MIKLSRPIYRDNHLWEYKKGSRRDHCAITQGFGENLVPFYKALGMDGHNGIDFRCYDGEPIYASHNGKVTKVYNKTNSSVTIGYGVYITDKSGFTTVYWHLLDAIVRLGQEVKDGQRIGHADNTGKYTTGTHLHWGLYPKDRDRQNGFGGAIDPLKYLIKKDMEYVIQGSEQYIRYNEPFKIAGNITDPSQLEDFKKKGLKGSPRVVTDMKDYMIFPLIDKAEGSEIIKRLRDVFGF